MIDRSELSGLGVAVLGHVGVIALVMWAAANQSEAKKPGPPMAIEVSLADEVALESSAPDASTEAPAAKFAPVEAPIEDDSAPAEPDEAVKPAPKPEPKPAPDATRDRSRPDRPAQTRPPGATQGARPSGGLPDYSKLAGTSDRPADSDSPKPQAAVMSNQAATNIATAINRQIQPCADRQVNPGPGANRIVVTIQLRLNRDGSLAARPVVVGEPTGVNESNERYVARVKDLAIAAFVGCAPLTGLPVELWDVPRGWKNFKMRYKLPD